MGNWYADKLGRIVGVQFGDEFFDRRKVLGQGLGGANVLFGRFNRPFPVVDARYRAADLYAGGESAIDECRGDSFGKCPVARGGSDLEHGDFLVSPAVSAGNTVAIGFIRKIGKQVSQDSNDLLPGYELDFQ